MAEHYEKSHLKTNRESESSNSSADSAQSEDHFKNKLVLGGLTRDFGLLSLSLVLAIASLIFSVIVFNWKLCERGLGSCVPCEDLILGPPQFQDIDFNTIVEKRLVSDKQYCCASSDDYISSFYNLVSIRV